MRAAILYTMVRECQRMRVDSEAWLTAVLLRLPDYRGDYLDLCHERESLIIHKPDINSSDELTPHQGGELVECLRMPTR